MAINNGQDETAKGVGILSFLGLLLITVSFCFPPLLSAQAQSTEAVSPGDDPSFQTIKEREVLIMGADIPYGVMEFLDESGKPAGIDVDIAKEIVAVLDVELRIETMPFDDLFGALRRQEIDVVVSAVTITPERQTKMLFSAPYMDSGMSIAVAKDNTDIKSEADLAGKRVGVLKGTVGEDIIDKSTHVDQSLVQRYKSNEKRIGDLLGGNLDAIIVHFLADDLPNIKIVEPPLTQSFYGIATRLENKSLMAAIDKALRELKRSGKISIIKKRYTN